VQIVFNFQRFKRIAFRIHETRFQFFRTDVTGQ